MANPFLTQYAQTHAPGGGILYEVNGDNNYVGVLIHGDGRTLQTLESQKGITSESQPYCSVTLSCGDVRVFATKDEFPASGTDVPCSSHPNHWFVVWVPVGADEVKPQTSGDPNVPPEAVIEGHTIEAKEPDLKSNVRGSRGRAV